MIMMANATTTHLNASVAEPVAPSTPVRAVDTDSRDAPARLSVSTNWPPVVIAFVTARGNTRRAAEAMEVQHELYVLELTQHMHELGDAVRAVTLLDAFDLATKTKKVVEYKIDEMKPEDLVKLYTQSLQQIERLTDNKVPAMGGTTNNIFGNVDTKIIQALPPHVQAAYMRLRESTPEAQPEPAYIPHEYHDSVDDVFKPSDELGNSETDVYDEADL
jgi:hypothetical protein